MERASGLLWAGCAAALLVSSAAPAAGQNWIANEQAAVAQARKANKPLVFFFRKNECSDKIDNRREAIAQAFRHPSVVALTQRHFVMCQTDAEVQTDLKRKLGAKLLDVIITTPDGDVILKLPPADTAQPEKIVEHLRGAAAAHVERVYQREVRPVLTAEAARPADLRKALTRTRQLGLESADADVLRLLRNDKLDTGVRDLAFDVLAELSTQAYVAALLDQAERYPRANAALRKCKPRAASHLAGELKGQPTPRFLRAYRALAAVCNTRAQPDEFWASADDDARRREIDRVKALARSAGG